MTPTKKSTAGSWFLALTLVALSATIVLAYLVR